MPQKFYLTNEASSDAPTAGRKATSAAPYTLGANNATTAEQSFLMRETKDNAETQIVKASDATTATRTNYMGRWTSEPLATQTINTGVWGFGAAFIESNTNADSFLTLAVYTAVPGGTAKKTTIYDSATVVSTEWVGSATYTGRVASFFGSTVSVDEGDVLVVEVFRVTDSNGQAMATAYNQGMIFGGSGADPTEGSTAGNFASYLNAPANINLSGGGGGVVVKRLGLLGVG